MPDGRGGFEKLKLNIHKYIQLLLLLLYTQMMVKRLIFLLALAGHQLFRVMYLSPRSYVCIPGVVIISYQPTRRPVFITSPVQGEARRFFSIYRIPHTMWLPYHTGFFFLLVREKENAGRFFPSRIPGGCGILSSCQSTWLAFLPWEKQKSGTSSCQISRHAKKLHHAVQKIKIVSKFNRETECASYKRGIIFLRRRSLCESVPLMEVVTSATESMKKVLLSSTLIDDCCQKKRENYKIIQNRLLGTKTLFCFWWGEPLVSPNKHQQITFTLTFTFRGVPR